MKKILGVFAVAAALIACDKKAEHPLQDSNVMLEEPAQVSVTDSSAMPTTDAAAAKASLQAKDSAATPEAASPAGGTTPSNNTAPAATATPSSVNNSTK